MIKTIDLRKNKDKTTNDLLRNGKNENNSVFSVVEKIIERVKSKGDTALFDYAATFDKVSLDKNNIKVTKKEIDEAYEKTDKALLEVIMRAKSNIEDFCLKQTEESWLDKEKDGIVLGQIVRPLEVVGIYVPGGTAAYPSSVLMNAIPAKVAGVKKIVMVTPPKTDGIDSAVLVAANEAGVDAIYKIGGAYAVAALAYGTESVPKVDKIVGPGNIYVATAKKMVFGECDIDSIAGPSEIMIIADKSSNTDFIVADMLAQAEHDALATSILVTDSEKIACEVAKKIEIQLINISRKDIAKESIDVFGKIVLVNNIEEAIDLANDFAPEHLELCIKEPFSKLEYIKNAGAVFLGEYSPEALGDYFAGPNHVLPTGGTARFSSPLSVDDFIKKSSVISYSKKALDEVKKDIITFADSEGLDAHANSVKIRFLK